jgi:pimeloyl-ACP methyl ester carboxylesterase
VLVRRLATLACSTALLSGMVGVLPAQARDGVPPDLPDGVPAAATRPEPQLRTPQGWPFAQRISRTSGTERLHGGASYWTDFVYDAHGAAVPSGLSLDNLALLAPEQGIYEQPAEAAGNGADVFVAATGADRRATYWRVDWTTLADPDVPIAVWALDTDRDAGTGVDAWPAAAGVTSPGLERALVVSSRGAWLHDLRNGEVVDVTDRGGRLSVDERSQSFVVRVPRRLLPATGSWRVRLATGLADATGEAMAAPTLTGGLPLPPGLPHVFNLAFRTPEQETPIVRDSQTAGLVAAMEALAAGNPLTGQQLGADGLARYVTGNFWMEDAQADALASGDASPFSHVVRWRDLATKRRTAEPLVRGHSNRWYLSRLDLGEGVLPNPTTEVTGDGAPNVLSPVQPYSVYVPTSYRRGEATPLTWTLHSLSVNHNQYAAYDPQLVQTLCEDRDSICAGTLGRGPDGWYLDEAEVDYWQVWRALADGFTLDPRRTVLTGYSMGGWAGYHLGLAHPDLYAEVVSLAGPPQCGVSVDGDQIVNPAFGGRCTTDGTAYDLVGNALHLPFRIGHGFLDQLVPFTSVERQVARFAALGLRHRFVRYPAEDHLLFATQDRFDTVLDGLGRPTVERDPRQVDLTWRPHLTRPGLGIGATTAYWLRGLAARDSSPGSLARVQAVSEGLPGTDVRVVTSGPTPVLSPLPALLQETTWEVERDLPISDVLTLGLTNVSRVTVDLARARWSCGTLQITSDGPAVVRLQGPRSTQRIEIGDGVRRVQRRC